jgi:Glucose / Sorbosone dehydrogenase
MKTSLSTAALLAVSLICQKADAAFPLLALKKVSETQLHSPTNFCHAGDGSGRLFVCDQPGLIYIFRAGMVEPTPFLDISADMPGIISTGYSERGLLGMTFHPGYSNPASPGYRCFYLYYTAPSTQATDNPVTHGGTTNCVSVIAEYKASTSNPDLANPTSKRIVLTLGQPQSNHNGGQLEFGPDGFLYIGTGDGGAADDNRTGHAGGTASAFPQNNLGNSLDRRFLWGKILRINPVDPDGAGPLNYGIPATNPFIGQTQDLTGTNYDGTMRGEIYAYGLRNPWRFSFDKRAGGTNRLFCGDVGQGRVEEINLITSGGNYGWRYKEGSFVLFSAMSTAGIAPSGDIPPIAQYAHPGVSDAPFNTLPQLGYSVTGGYVYRGTAISGLQGKYVFADYGQTGGPSQGRLMGLEETAPSSGTFNLTQTLNLIGGNPITQRILCMGEDEQGELYLGTKTNGGVLQLENGLPAGGIYKIISPTLSTVNLTASADTSLFAESGDLSNGVGQFLFAGNTAAPNNYAPRRALLRFNLSSVPAGAAASSASVSLVMDRTVVGAIPFQLHRLTASWAEGSSNAGNPGGTGAPAQINDATWTLRQVLAAGPPATGNAWTTAGGDFSPAASATTSVNGNGSYSWTGAGLITDINTWLTTPSSNNGWLLKSNETANTTEAKRFYSREDSTASNRPQLALTYGVLPSATARDTWVTTHFPGQPAGYYINPNADLDGDTLDNLIEYAYNFSPTQRNSPSSTSFSITRAPISGGSQITLTFRRHTAAVDLTYTLETSTDLITWTPIAISTAGGSTTGQNGATVLSETSLGSNTVLVTVQRTLATGSDQRLFSRLKVTQAP